jgi:hypothetical protein
MIERARTLLWALETLESDHRAGIISWDENAELAFELLEESGIQVMFDDQGHPHMDVDATDRVLDALNDEDDHEDDDVRGRERNA